jgi:hypothetical protein
VTKARPLTQFLRDDAPTPMEDDALKHAFKKTQISFSSYINPSDQIGTNHF